MAILNFSYATVKDSEKFQQYIEQAARLMQDYPVETIVRGEFLKTQRGQALPAHITAVFRYPDLATAEAFYQSAAYQQLIPLRDAACDMTIQFYEAAE